MITIFPFYTSKVDEHCRQVVYFAAEAVVPIQPNNATHLRAIFVRSLYLLRYVTC